ncbi:MAG: helix-turn-helix transcriptional regulator [Firmicutes bacterium]|jgi:transcriptional regulator with XRE-family HTH domain|nr:helix-turn-helix transcriptional regulator [Bacillota bacterium]
MVNFRANIKKLRQQNHMTQKELAQRVGVSKAMISAYETEMRYPSYDVLIKLAATFGVTTDFLLGLEKKNIVDVTGLDEEEIQIINSLISVFRKRKKR